jgi:predicted KAP-like P-loop ATPase
VEKSLESIAPITGREFLEKIVQVGFDIPRIERTRLEKVLFAGLDHLLTDERVGQRFSQHRWGNIFIPGLRPYFNTLRDVHRFLGTFSFHVSLFKSTGSFEVNPIDLIALEVLRVFEPDVYQKLPDNKRALTEQRDRESTRGDREEATRRQVESIIEQAIGANRTQVREILKQLFPPAEWVFGGLSYSSGFEEEWFRDLRVCHPDVFDRYFHFVIPEGDISQAELDRILSLAGDRENLAAELRAINRRGLLGVALDRLEAYKERIDLRHAVPLITALFDIGDELPDEPVGFFEISAELHASRIIHWYLKQENDLRRRGQILKEAMLATTGLYLPIRKISLEDNRERRQQNPDAFILSEEDLPELRTICVEKIRRAAESGKLKTSKNMAYILYQWRGWTSPEEPRNWVTTLVESQDGLLSFLTAVLQRSMSHGVGDYVSREHWKINLQNLEDFVSVDVIEQKVNNLALETLGDKEQKAVQAFRKALRRRREGRPDQGFWPDEDD